MAETDNYNFNYRGQKISPIDLQYGIMGMESSWGKNTTPRYEPKYHQQLLANKTWIPTPAEQRVIKERGYGAATKQFSTSYGPYQILPETAYRYTSFSGNPEDLARPEVATQVYIELIQRMRNRSKGNLVSGMRTWNKNPDYLPKMMAMIKSKV
jgi:hypothetical protein